MAQFLKFGPVQAGDVDSEAALAGDVLTSDGAGNAAWVAAAGGGGCADILYADLVTAIGAGTLTRGGFYRITDFATTHFILDADGVQYTAGDGIIVGPNEPLIVLAVDVDEISAQAYSEQHPEDVIYYDWDPANWLADLSFGDVGTGLIIAGFKGVITFRRDTFYDNYAPGDWRNCKTRRWKTAAVAWDAGTNYVAGDIVSHAATTRVYRAVRASLNQVPVGVDNGYWVVMLDLTTYEYWNPSPITWLGVLSGVDYDDFTLFDSGQPSTVHIEPSLQGFFGTILPNSVFFDASACALNQIGSTFSFNTSAGNLYNNTIGPGFVLNSIADGFGNNTIGASMSGNAIGSAFSVNSIAALFQDNTIGTGFGNNILGASCYGNVISAGCYGNVIANGFSANYAETTFAYNSIGYGFSGNTVGSDFRFNKTADNAITATDFLAATHVYAAYNCDLYIDSILGARLCYIANDVPTYAAVTA